jgi:hypothetical protein
MRRERAAAERDSEASGMDDLWNSNLARNGTDRNVSEDGGVDFTS